jgi:hypothetical protein
MVLDGVGKVVCGENVFSFKERELFTLITAFGYW